MRSAIDEPSRINQRESWPRSAAAGDPGLPGAAPLSVGFLSLQPPFDRGGLPAVQLPQDFRQLFDALIQGHSDLIAKLAGRRAPQIVRDASFSQRMFDM